MDKTTHHSWEYGVLDIIPIRPKTSKTLCERRVKIEQIDNVDPTCPVCRALARLDKLTADRLTQELNQTKEV